MFWLKTFHNDGDISKLANSTGLQRNTVLEYLNYLKDVKLINMLYSDLQTVKKMQKPDKIFLDKSAQPVNVLLSIS
ncbi:MAG: hypothetical protein II956_12310 [Bacteroidales bacterium]|nr:hypothetical protein [Bacteroidales bacterium]